MRLLATVSIFALLAAAPALAQTGTGNPATMAPGTPQSVPGMPAPNQPNQNDRLFVYEATIGGAAEVEFGQLAEQKGRSQAVKDFGRQMVTDHGKANQQLMQLAQAANIPQPGQLDEEHKAMRGAAGETERRGFRPRLYSRAGRRPSKDRTAVRMGDRVRSGSATEGLRLGDPARRAPSPADGGEHRSATDRNRLCAKSAGGRRKARGSPRAALTSTSGTGAGGSGDSLNGFGQRLRRSRCRLLRVLRPGIRRRLLRISRCRLLWVLRRRARRRRIGISRPVRIARRVR